MEAQLTYSKVQLFRDKISEILASAASVGVVKPANFSTSPPVSAISTPITSTSTSGVASGAASGALVDSNSHSTSSHPATAPVTPTVTPTVTVTQAAGRIKAFQIVGLREVGKGALSDIRVAAFSHADNATNNNNNNSSDSSRRKSSGNRSMVSPTAQQQQQQHKEYTFTNPNPSQSLNTTGSSSNNNSNITTNSSSNSAVVLAGAINMNQYLTQVEAAAFSATKHRTLSPPRRQPPNSGTITASQQQQPQLQSTHEARSIKSGASSMFSEEMRQRQRAAKADTIEPSTLVTTTKPATNMNMFRGIRPKLISR